MPNIPKTLLILPCYNEANRLDPAAFTDATARHAWLHLLFVDDGSTDESGAILDRICEACPEHLQVLGLPKNSGKWADYWDGELED